MNKIAIVLCRDSPIGVGDMYIEKECVILMEKVPIYRMKLWLGGKGGGWRSEGRDIAGTEFVSMSSGPLTRDRYDREGFEEGFRSS